MKKTTIVLIITGVMCTLISVICIIAAAVKLADMGITFAQTSVNGEEFVWNTDGNWDWNYQSSDSDNSDSSAPENVDVNLPFLHVDVDGDNVHVNLPGIQVDVNDKTNKVTVKIGDETLAADSSQSTDASAPAESTAETTIG